MPSVDLDYEIDVSRDTLLDEQTRLWSIGQPTSFVTAKEAFIYTMERLSRNGQRCLLKSDCRKFLYDHYLLIIGYNVEVEPFEVTLQYLDPGLGTYISPFSFTQVSQYDVYNLVSVFSSNVSVSYDLLSTIDYPHTCPVCGARACILFRTIECSNGSCVHGK